MELFPQILQGDDIGFSLCPCEFAHLNISGAYHSSSLIICIPDLTVSGSHSLFGQCVNLGFAAQDASLGL